MENEEFIPPLTWVAGVLARIDLHTAYRRLTLEIGGQKFPEPYTTAERITHLTGISEVHLRLLSASGFVPRFRFGKRICYNLEALTYLLRNLIELKQKGEA